MAEMREYRFRDPASLVKWTRWSVYAQLTLACVAVFSGYLERSVLVRLREGSFPSREAAIQAAHAKDIEALLRANAVSVVSHLTMIALCIAFLMLFNRINNMQSFGRRILCGEG